MSLVGSSCQNGSQCGTIQQTGNDAGGNATYGCVTTRSCSNARPYNQGTIGAADGTVSESGSRQIVNRIHKGGTANPSGGFGCYVNGVWKSPCPAKADMTRRRTDGSEYSSIMSSMDAMGWPEGYLNATGNDLDALKAVVTADIATLNTLQAQYDNANGRMGWLNDWTTWCKTNATCSGSVIGGQPATSVSDDTKNAFYAIGVTDHTLPQNVLPAVNAALSAWSTKIAAAKKKLADDQQTYNDALAVAGQTDPDTIQAVAKAQATVLAAQSSSSTTKWIIGGGVVLVLGLAAFFIFRKKD